MIKESDNLILCQPDKVKGCSVCCGLFNLLDTGKNNLSLFLSDGVNRESAYRIYNEYTEPSAVRDSSTHICPYQGFLSNGKPGCLIHPLTSGAEQRDRSLFASSVCSKFLCPAHKLLNSGEKTALIKLVDDWYLYSTAIADPDSFSFIYQYASELSAGGGIRNLITVGLSTHAANLSSYEGIIFFYSVPEYNTFKNFFSLNFREEYRSAVTDAMIKCHARG